MHAGSSGLCRQLSSQSPERQKSSMGGFGLVADGRAKCIAGNKVLFSLGILMNTFGAWGNLPPFRSSFSIFYNVV